MKLEEIGFYTLSDDRCKNASETSDLMRCELILTDACNFKCGYCRGQRKDLKKNLSFNEAKAIVDKWVSSGLRNIRLSGGEPTIWAGLEELVKHCKASGIERIAISSNGSASLEYYQTLIDAGVNDFSISLDACCASFGDLMAGREGVWTKVVDCIKFVSTQVYTTVGIVVTEESVHTLNEIVVFAAGLGVQDIRIISAAQYDKLLDNAKNIPSDLYEKFPILKYRIENIFNNVNVRSIGETDSHRCGIAIDDMIVAGDYHYPCVIYFREQGDPIGRMDGDFRKERAEWINKHDTHKDEICKKNCLDCIVKYNNKYDAFRLPPAGSP